MSLPVCGGALKPVRTSKTSASQWVRCDVCTAFTMGMEVSMGSQHQQGRGMGTPRVPWHLYFISSFLIKSSLPFCRVSHSHLLNPGRLCAGLFLRKAKPPRPSRLLSVLFISPRLIPCQLNESVVTNKMKIRAY